MMLKHLSAVILSVVLAAPAVAAPGDDLADKYFAGKNPELTAQEREALRIAKKWGAGSATGIKPVAGANGAVRFIYGAQQPSIVCAVLQVCDVALQPGELVNSIHLGDTARWLDRPAGGIAQVNRVHQLAGLQGNIADLEHRAHDAGLLSPVDEAHGPVRAGHRFDARRRGRAPFLGDP